MANPHARPVNDPAALITVAVVDRQLPRRRLDHAFFQRIAQDALRFHAVTSAQLDLVFVDDAAIHRVNRDYLKHDYPTDIITFDYRDEEEDEDEDEDEDDGPEDAETANDAIPPAIPIPHRPKAIEGELIISVETAERSARDAGVTVEEELALYVVHGILHLLGFDDQDPRSAADMKMREAETLTHVGLPRAARREIAD